MKRRRKVPRTASPRKPRRGRWLERLVAKIEQGLHGCAIEIRSPAFLPDRETGNPREIDVLIRVPVGSVQLHIAFECRDRGRVEDVRWIEELIGKRNSVDVHKLVAVSSNGFTKASISKAKAHGIELRVLSALTPERIRQLIPFSELHVHRTDARVVRWSLSGSRLDGTLAVPVPAMASLEITLTERCLRVPGTSELFSLQELVEKYKSQILAAADTSIPTISMATAEASRAADAVDNSELLHVVLKLPPLEEVWAGMCLTVDCVELDVATTRTFTTIPIERGQSYGSADGPGPPSALRFEVEHTNTMGLPERIEVLVFPTEQRVSVSAIQP